ncbi:hypothetical protein F5Y10DRAFT_243370 [Nemania abortiva]|nr:hypothetical protein F5Y10DRAFT_243370 [Nemania abortiva]
MSGTNSGSCGSDSEAAAVAPNTPQRNDSMPRRAGRISEDDPIALFNALYDEETPDVARSLLLKVKTLSREAQNNYATAKDGHLTTLHSALCRGFYDLVPDLIELATNKNEFVIAPDGSGRTALHWAACTSYNINNIELVKIFDRLIAHATEKNKYVTAQDKWGETALHCLANNNLASSAALNYLIDAVESPSTYVRMLTKNGETALHHAVARKATEGSLEPLDTLLARSGNSKDYINTRCERGRTPLHRAAEYDVPKAAVRLLQSGADAEIIDDDGNTAWDVACSSGNSWRFLAVLTLWTRKQLIFKGITTPTTNMAEVNIRLGDTVCCSKIMNRARADLYSLQPEDLGLIQMMAGILTQVRKEFRENQESQRLFLRFREPSCTVLDIKLANGDQPNSDQPDGDRSFESLSLVIPYFQVDNSRIIDKRGEVKYAKQTENTKYPVFGRKFRECHMPTTLDEYCNPSLPKDVLDERNNDQVLGRYERKKRLATTTPLRNNKEKSRGLLVELGILVRAHTRKFGQYVGRKISREPKTQEEANKTAKETKTIEEGEEATTEREIKPEEGGASPGTLVFVRQAWIWKIWDDVIMTKVSPDFPASSDRLYWSNPAQRIAWYLSELVQRLGGVAGGPEGSLLRTYENALVDISEEVSQYTKTARVEDIDLDTEKSLFHQISDLRGELSMIKSVLAEQEEVWTEFMRLMGPNKGPDQQLDRRDTASQSSSSVVEDARWKELRQPRTQFDKYKRRIKKIEEDAERVQQNISTMLDLKQKHATMREAHSAAILSATVFGFTIITVIFAPLAFVAALFALPIDKFNEGKYGQDGVYSSSYIGKWSAAAELVSIAVTLIAMWAGLRFAGLHVWGQRGLREYIRQTADAEYQNMEKRNREEKSKDESKKKVNNRDENNEENTSTGERKPQLRSSLGTRLNRMLGKKRNFGVGETTNDIELAERQPQH